MTPNYIPYKSFDILKDLMQSKNFSKEIFGKDTLLRFLHPLTYHLYMNLNFGDDYYDFEFEVIRKIFNDYPEFLDRIINYHGILSIIYDYGEETKIDVIENGIQAFADNKISCTWKQNLFLPHVCDFLAIINKIFPITYKGEFASFFKTYFEFSDFPIKKQGITDQLPYTENWFNDFEIPENSLYTSLNEAVNLFLFSKNSILRNLRGVLKDG